MIEYYNISTTTVEDMGYYNPLTLTFSESDTGYYCSVEDKEFCWEEGGEVQNLATCISSDKSSCKDMDVFKENVLTKQMGNLYKGFRAAYDLQQKINNGEDMKSIALSLQLSNNDLWDEVCEYRLQFKVN